MTAGQPYGAFDDGALAVSGDRIVYAGPAAELPAKLGSQPAQRLDAGGGWVTPGLIDCHTHLVFGGNRAHEFELRLGGASYEDIARAGGGILSTVRDTRAASEEELTALAGRRLRAMSRMGVTTAEVKSGYGLDLETELKMLRAAGGADAPVTLSRTLLGAHALPPEYAGRRADYVSLVCEEMIPRAAEEGLADAVDAFCEAIAFSTEESAAVLAAGADHGLAGRLHADQLTDGGGAALAAAMGARSADHLEYTSETGVAAMAAAGTTAVLLPGAYYFLQEDLAPPVRAFRKAGVPMAVATDFNPGSSPISSPLVAMNMACVLFGMTPEEALAGMTRNAAPVLGMAGERGVLAEGYAADFVVWDIDHPAELSYWVGTNPVRSVVRAGLPLVAREPA